VRRHIRQDRKQQRGDDECAHRSHLVTISSQLSAEDHIAESDVVEPSGLQTGGPQGPHYIQYALEGSPG
jgi:hypothetical protein